MIILKAVAFTDLHLGVATFHTRIKGMLSAFADQLITEVKPDFIICLGDVFHTKKPDSDTVEFATQLFKKLADSVENIMIIPGNHDRDAYNNTTATDYLDDITTNIEVLHEPVESMDFLFMPYMRVLTPEMRKKIKLHPQVFLHQGYSEAIMYGTAKYGQRTDSVTDEELYHKDLALIGHVHIPYYNSAKNIYVLGSPYQLRYADPLQERGFACWEIGDLSTFQILPYIQNFYLQALNVSLPASKKTLDMLIKSLPSPAPEYYYQINLSIEGKLQPAEEEKIRSFLHDQYKGCLDGVSIVSVVPQKDRKFYTELKVASSLQELKAPPEMLSIYMEETQGSFYQANPDFKKAVLKEFTNIVSTVSEKGEE